MSFGWSFQRLWLYVLFVQCNVRYVTGVWPSSNSSTIQLLGIFRSELNESQAAPWFFQSRAMFIAAILLAQQYNMTIGGQFIGWQLLTTRGSMMNALSSTCQVISTSNIAGIVGPTYSREAHVIVPFTADLGIPVISYAATDPELSDRQAYPNFYRTVPSDNDAALAIAKLFMKYNWTSCIIIYQNDAFGSGGAKTITDTFTKYNLLITETIMFDMLTLTIRGDLKSLLISSLARIIILWAETKYASLVVQNALDSDVLGPQFTWILGSDIPFDSFSENSYGKLAGMLFIGPVVGNVVNAPINRTLLNDAYNIWKKYEPESFPGLDDVDDYALFTFDATWSLIRSLEQLCSTTNTSCISFVDTSYCFDRRLLNSSSLLDIINSNAFLGISGPVEFSMNATDRINGTYYVVRNVQSFSNNLNYVPVLVSSASQDWTSHGQTNTIIWPGKSLVAPTGYAAIAGVILRIAVIETAPFTMIKEIKDQNGQITTKLTGYVPDLIDHLQAKMGFVPNIIWLPENQSYNALIDAVANGVYDMVVGDVTIIAARREKVAFSDAIFDNSLRVIVRDAPAVNVNLLGFMKPFSYKLWLLLLAALVWSAILLCVYEGPEHEELKERSIPSRMVMSIWFTIGTLVGYGVDFHVKTAAGRFLTVGLYILSLVLIAAYTANLTSNLTLLKSQELISGIDDIKNGRIPWSRVGIITSTSVEAYFLREISDGSRNFYPLVSKEDTYNKLLNKVIDASIMDSGVIEYITNGVYCNLTLVGTAFDHSAFGIVYPKKWLYGQVLDVTILSLRESGIFNELKRKWFQQNYCAHSSDEQSTDLSLESMAGLFVTFGSISILSIVLFAWVKRASIKYRLFRIPEPPEDEINMEMQSPHRSSSESHLVTATRSWTHNFFRRIR